MRLPAPSGVSTRLRHQTSRKRTSFAFCSMNTRRGSTWSPISVEKIEVGRGRVLDLDPHENAVRRIHRRLPELVRVHLAEALEPADCTPSLASSSAPSRSSANVSAVARFVPIFRSNGGGADDLGEPRVRLAHVRVDRRREQLGRHRHDASRRSSRVSTTLRVNDSARRLDDRHVVAVRLERAERRATSAGVDARRSRRAGARSTKSAAGARSRRAAARTSPRTRSARA